MTTPALPAPLRDASTVAFVHAHPDDETLATGALIAALSDSGKRVVLLTATRGERGEVVPGSLPAGTEPEALVAARERELAAACRVLGVAEADWLGAPPARAEGLPERRYTDSGMRWVAPGLAGPSDDAGPDALTSAPLDEVAGDIAAWLRASAADLVVSYDELGTYGHPDHVVVHRASVEAARRWGIPFLEVVSPQADDEPPPVWVELADRAATVRAALACYRTQLAVDDSVDGAEVVHVGGQREPIVTRVGLRCPSLATTER